MTTRRQPKICMRPKIAGACEQLNQKQKARYNFRLRCAGNLGFRFRGDVVRPKSLRRWLDEHHYHTHQGKCAVCGKPAPCPCPVEVQEMRP